jgi:PAS domain-containing protein
MAVRLRDLEVRLLAFVTGTKKSDAVIDSIYEPVIVTDARSNVMKTNRAAKALFNSASAEGRGKPVSFRFQWRQQILTRCAMRYPCSVRGG